MLVYLFVPVVLAGVFFFLNLVNKGSSSQQAISEANAATATTKPRPKKQQTKPARKPVATNAASKDTKDVTLNNVEEEVDIRQYHAVQTRRMQPASSLAAKEEPKKEEVKETKPVVAEVKQAQPVVESSKKKKKNDGFQVVTKPEVTGRPQKPKREDSESTPTEEGSSVASSSKSARKNKKGGKKGDKKEEKKDPNKSIYKSLTPVTPTVATEETSESEEKAPASEEASPADKKDDKKKKQRAADKEKQPRKPKRESVIVTNPYKDVDDFWSDEPVKSVQTTSSATANTTAAKAQSEPVKKNAQNKKKKSPVSNKQESGVVIVGSEVNPWANVGSVSETSDEAFPKLGEQPKRKKVVSKQAVDEEEEEEEEETKNPHKRESETHFEVQFEAPYEKKAKLNSEEEEEEEVEVAQTDAAEM